jgi:hypothetical protein
VRSLRRNVVGNQGLTDEEFEAELGLDGDLSALVTAMTDAELENVRGAPDDSARCRCRPLPGF